MAINRLDFGTVPNPVGGDWALNAAILAKAFQNDYSPLQVDSTNIPQGATFQVGGVIYYTASDTAITGTPSLYVKLTPNVGDSGATLDAAFVANLSGVTWNKIYNGYYDVSGNLYIFDETIDSLANTKIGQLANNIMPIGFVYTQYPTKDSPVTLGFVGTWTDISSEFPGDFFRTEGGNASAFESGQQIDLFKEHQHTSSAATVTLDGTLLTRRGTTGPVEYPTSLVGGVETRPVNRTIRLWERTA